MHKHRRLVEQEYAAAQCCSAHKCSQVAINPAFCVRFGQMARRCIQPAPGPPPPASLAQQKRLRQGAFCKFFFVSFIPRPVLVTERRISNQLPIGFVLLLICIYIDIHTR